MNEESFLPIYDGNYAKHMKKRRHTFRQIFEYLETMFDYPLIVETGTTRHLRSFGSQGMSTMLFDRFVAFRGGELHSVDHDPEACKVAKGIVGMHSEIICSDSIKYLWNCDLPSKISLLYLDSLDLDVKNPFPSMVQHFKEFCAGLPKMADLGLVVVDDHLTDSVGKDKYIREFLEGLGVERFIDGYQIGWIIRRKR